MRDFRLAGKSAVTRKIALAPARFHVENMPTERYLAIQKVPLGKREYIPMAFMEPDVICSDLLHVVPGASLYHFGMLTQSVHMAWMRAVAERLSCTTASSGRLRLKNTRICSHPTMLTKMGWSRFIATAEAQRRLGDKPPYHADALKRVPPADATRQDASSPCAAVSSKPPYRLPKMPNAK